MFIYRIKIKVNDVAFFYVGSTEKPVEKRLKEHLKNPTSSLMKRLLKEGTYDIKVMRTVDPNTRLLEEEKSIKWFKSKGFLVANKGIPTTQKDGIKTRYYVTDKEDRTLTKLLRIRDHRASNDASKGRHQRKSKYNDSLNRRASRKFDEDW